MAQVVFGYRAGQSLLHALDARVKLAALAGVSVASLAAGLPALALAVAASLALLVLARCPVLHCLAGLKWYAVLLACVLATRAVTTAGEPLLPFPWLPATREGLLAGLGLAGRLLVIALMGLALTFTTRPAQIRTAVAWFLAPVPFVDHHRAATMIGLLVRFIPVILNHSAELDAALRARALDNRRNPMRRMNFLAMPLLRRTFVTADRLGQAMEARCYGAGRAPRPMPFAPRDWAALAAATAFCLLLVGCP